ncbi:MAG: hypothetical protein ACKO6N_13340 [Myxococcota bacterium]
MRVLIVFHGPLPYGPYPVPGCALRAYSLGEGLRTHGIEVLYASRAQDLAPPDSSRPPVYGYANGVELQQLVISLAPSCILAVGHDELVHLEHLSMPVILDCFAPRLLEAQWEETDTSQESMALLSALARADYYLVTTSRARYHLLGLLPVAGVDCREDRLLTVPLSVPPSPPAPKLERNLHAHPLLVAGGVAWPWQDPSWALQHTVRALERHPHARVRLLRGPYPLHAQGASVPPLPVEPSEQVQVEGLLPYPDCLRLYSTAWAALDLMAPNLERELALSFRQLDALQCGLPLIIGAHAPLAALIADFQAGWVVRHGDPSALETALEEVLSQPKAVQRKSWQVHKLARTHFDASETVKPLLETLAQLSRRKRRESLNASLARRATEAHHQEETLRRLEQALLEAGQTLLKKDQELLTLQGQVQTLTTTTGRLALSLEEQSWLRRLEQEQGETRAAHTRLESLDFQRLLEETRRQLHKKEEELMRQQTLREGLEQALQGVHEAEASSRNRAENLQQRVSVLLLQLGTQEERAQQLAQQLELAQEALTKKQQELESLWHLRDELRAEHNLQQLTRAQERLTWEKSFASQNLQLSQLQQQYEQGLEQLRVGHLRHIEALQQSHGQAMNEQQQRLQQSHGQAMNEQQQRLTQLQQQLEQAEQTRLQVEQRLTQLQQQLEQAEQTRLQVEQRLSERENTLQAQGAQLQTAQEQQRRALDESRALEAQLEFERQTLATSEQLKAQILHEREEARLECQRLLERLHRLEAEQHQSLRERLSRQLTRPLHWMKN